MELAEPSIATAYNECVRQGALQIVVHPFFLLPGRHWDRDIPQLAAEAAAEHPHGAAEGGPEPVVPLADQIDGRGDDKRPTLGLGDGELGHECLSASGGKHHGPAAAGFTPGTTVQTAADAGCDAAGCVYTAYSVPADASTQYRDISLVT